MPDLIYPAGKEGLLGTTALGAKIDLLVDTIRLVLVDTGAYTYSAAHVYLSDIPAGARIATSDALSGKTCTLGVFDASDSTFGAVAGASIETGVLIKDTGVVATSRLISIHGTATGLPFTPSGTPVVWTWPAGGIFAL